MVSICIDGKQLEVNESLTILEAAAQADIRIPTLCYLKDVNEIGVLQKWKAKTIWLLPVIQK